MPKSLANLAIGILLAMMLAVPMIAFMCDPPVANSAFKALTALAHAVVALVGVKTT